MATDEVSGPARRLNDMELLLRRMHAAATLADAADLIERWLPELANADWAELHLSTIEPGCGSRADQVHRLAMSAQSAGCVCTLGRDGGAVAAVPLDAGSAGTGAIVLGRVGGRPFHRAELRLIRLFADHAASTFRLLVLRRPA